MFIGFTKCQNVANANRIKAMLLSIESGLPPMHSCRHRQTPEYTHG